MTRIWGIGLSKTGTLSLHEALTALGYRSRHCPSPADLLAGRLECLRDLDAAMDIPIAHRFRELDLAFPGSRFILTVREPQAWLESITSHLAARPASRLDEPTRRMREAVYGAVEPGRDDLLAAFHAHHESVARHFAHRATELLVLDICAGQGWEKLCPFLAVPVPRAPFPHAHKRANTAHPAAHPAPPTAAPSQPGSHRALSPRA